MLALPALPRDGGGVLPGDGDVVGSHAWQQSRAVPLDSKSGTLNRAVQRIYSTAAEAAAGPVFRCAAFVDAALEAKKARAFRLLWDPCLK